MIRLLQQTYEKRSEPLFYKHHRFVSWNHAENHKVKTTTLHQTSNGNMLPRKAGGCRPKN